MSGTKTLINRSTVALQVTLLGRNGSDPQAPSDRQVTVNIAAGQMLPQVSYGDDANPYLNGLILTRDNTSSQDIETLRVVQRGDVGTLDNKLNANGTFEFTYDPSTNAFSVIAHN